jgi:predicted HTH domain antitoxin
MKAGVLLSPKESRRAYVVEQLIAGSITVAQAASVLDLSTRQVKRLKKGC